MSIEFRCTGCNKLLRVAEETAGKKARCPGCSAVLNIPEPEISELDIPELDIPAIQGPVPSAKGFPNRAGGSHAGGGNPFGAGPPDSGNPFQSPMTEDPYQSGGTRTYSDKNLAPRLTRLGAVILDGLLGTAILIPVLAVCFAILANSGGQEPQRAQVILFLVALLVGVFGILALMIYQWYLISTTGQSLGKKWLGIRILLEEGRTMPGFVNGVILRSWVPILIGAVPCIGGMFSIVDPLMIFSDERRTLHDMIAGTIVVEA